MSRFIIRTGTRGEKIQAQGNRIFLLAVLFCLLAVRGSFLSLSC